MIIICISHVTQFGGIELVQKRKKRVKAKESESPSRVLHLNKKKKVRVRRVAASKYKKCTLNRLKMYSTQYSFLQLKSQKRKTIKIDGLLKSLCSISTQAESELTYKFYIWS